MGKFLPRGLIYASLLLLSACQQSNPAPLPEPDLHVSALLSTPDATADALAVTVQPDGSGYTVTLTAGQASLGSELYLALDYDAGVQHAVDLTTASSDRALGLAVEPEPGRIEFGLVSTTDEPLATDSPLLAFRLAPGPAPRVVSAKVAANAVETRPRYMELKYAGDGWELRWDYTNPGDTNQNSMVGLEDLTPLGSNFRATLNTGWNNPLRNVDCDRNGEINISDISVIGYGYRNEVYSYMIQGSADGLDNWSTLDEVLLAEQPVQPSQALRFAYKFGDRFQDGLWYRVQPLTHAREPGVPSEALSDSRRIIDTTTSEGDTVKVVVSAFDLPAPLRMMNSVRLVYPSTFSYVKNSYNVGSVGGASYAADGIWGDFASELLTPPDSFYPDKLYVESNLGNGFTQINFNVSVVESFLDNSPENFGDLFNFEIRNEGGEDERLLISWEDTDRDYGYKTTYYSDNDDQEYFFGNTLMITVY